jgi:arabinofuranosyltransferase
VQCAFPEVPLGVLMAIIGTVLTIVAFALVALGAAALAGSLRVVSVPAGLLVLAALPPVWDFGTSGLETSMSLAWIASCFCALTMRGRARPEPVVAWRPWPIPVLIGLGVLIRPDFALLSAAFGLMLIWRSRRTVFGVPFAVAMAAALPLLYEVFRMGYYAALVPNTALAKSGGNISDGLNYLIGFAATYWLIVPLLLAAALLFAVPARREGVSANWVLRLGFPAAAFLHTAFVVSVGGDFMHGRFLLPAMFMFFAPVAVVPFQGWRRPIALALAIWAGVCASTMRPQLWDGMVTDERSIYVAYASTEVGSTLLPKNWDSAPIRVAHAAGVDQARGESYFIFEGVPRDHIPRSGPGVVVTMVQLGVPAIAAGPDVIINDAPSLGDPIGARLILPPTQSHRVGHALKPGIWALARYARPADSNALPGFADAEAVLRCRPVADLLSAVSEPMTPQRFLRNVMQAPRLTFLRIPSDPAEARRVLC